MPRANALGFFMGIGLPSSRLRPSHPAAGKDVDFVHPRSMSWSGERRMTLPPPQR